MKRFVDRSVIVNRMDSKDARIAREIGIPKPRPHLLDKRDTKAEIAATDRAENANVKSRSLGQCECIVVFPAQPGLGPMYAMPLVCPCRRRASQYHHLISGIGRRNVGRSIKAEHKLHLCDKCHGEIHGHVLKPMNEQERYDASTVRYERVT